MLGSQEMTQSKENIAVLNDVEAIRIKFERRTDGNNPEINK